MHGCTRRSNDVYSAVDEMHEERRNNICYRMSRVERKHKPWNNCNDECVLHTLWKRWTPCIVRCSTITMAISRLFDARVALRHTQRWVSKAVVLIRGALNDRSFNVEDLFLPPSTLFALLWSNGVCVLNAFGSRWKRETDSYHSAVSTGTTDAHILTHTCIWSRCPASSCDR